jgi:molybdopterin molybdotransferase
VPRTIEPPQTPTNARALILGLAEPNEPVEVSLADAVGLVLAEDVVADVDLPSTDRASAEGYAVHAAEAKAGTLLRVAGLRWSNRPLVDVLDAGEAVRVLAGDPLPVGADAVARLDEVRPDPDAGPTRVVEVLREATPWQGVARRGQILEAGEVLVPAGTRLAAPMVALLASQGCVHPLCHRRVRVAIVAVGEHLVAPGEAPVMNRERNAANAAIVSLTIQAGAMPHDLQAVAEPDVPGALERATSAPVIVILGPRSRSIARALKAVGAEPVIARVGLKPGRSSRHWVIRDDSGRVAHHVFHLPPAPVAASTAFALLVRPLIAHLQGGPDAKLKTVPAVWEGAWRRIGNCLRAVPVTLEIDAEARHRARPIAMQGVHDLAGFALADGLALLPAGSGPWVGGEVVEVVRLG